MLQYLDFSHHASTTSRKWGHKQMQGDGFEAPRNSMEFTSEASHSYGVFQEDRQYSSNMRQYQRSGGLNHSSAPIMKKLTHEDVSFRANESHKRPGVIARLMGMDSPPLNTTTESSSHSGEIRRHEIISRPMPRRDQAEMISAAKHHVSLQPKDTFKHAPKLEIRAYDKERDDLFVHPGKKNNEWSKPQPREHPQEEELQKFKKEFEAWQTSRLREQSSRSLEAESHHDDDKYCTAIVPHRYQQHQQKENDAKNGSKCMLSKEDVMYRRKSKESSTSISGSRTFSLTSADHAHSSRLPLSRFFHEDEEQSLSPTRIVILKPCPELSTDDVEESSMGSPELVKKENNMEAFLEEVKKRLKIELEGRMASDDNAADRWDWDRGDNPADPKQIARNIANQIRRNVTRDLLHPVLVRSESTRSYCSDAQLNGQSPVDYIGRDARRQLSNRLKNVLRSAPDAEPPFSHGRRGISTSSFDDKARHDMASRNGRIRSREEKCSITSDVRSLRHGSHKTSSPADSEPVSPRNLIRSLSAPVSAGTTFVKLLTEEPRVLTGAQQLHRKQEGNGTSRPLSEERKQGRKDHAFNIKGKVFNLRQNLLLRAKLFGNKFNNTSDESSFPDDLPPIGGAYITAPSVLTHHGVLQENSTEVPPSPASWCSSPTDEKIRGGYPSPVSPLEASFNEHRSPLRTATKPDTSSSDFCAPGNSQEQFQSEEEVPETSHFHEDNDTDGMDDNPTKFFVRAVLSAAGLYGQRQNPSNLLSSDDSETKPIPRWVLDEVLSNSEAAAPEGGEQAAINRLLLFDLINEALPGAIRASMTLCAFDNKWYPIASAPGRGPGSKRLLDTLWKCLQAWLQPPSSLDEFIDRDLGAPSWNGTFRRDDMDALGTEVGVEILDELIDETVWDVLLNVGD